MRALCALAFILFAAAPTFVAAQSVSVDKSCYNVDSQGFVDIVITVQNDANPAPLDWIGIFPAGSSQMTDIGAWLFTCGDKFCMKAESQGMVPLKTSLVVGDWKAVLSRSNMPPYVPYAVSPTFTVSSACSAISSGTVTTNSQPAIQVGGDTFLAGQTIPISYQLHGSSSGIDEFIGIFPSSISSDQLLNEGLLWKLLCDRQGTNCPLFAISSEGTVNFSGSSATWHQTTDWPLQAGTYRAYMLKNNVEASFWPVIAQSNTFTIITTTPNINGQALTHLTNARSAIESLIRSDDTLAPKFLRMGFHDCIGGCDGCIDMSNQANLGLAKPMNALSDIVSQHAVGGVSRADIWALAATVGADITQNPNSRIDFPFNTWGRVNCEDTGSPCLDESGNSVTCSSTLGPHRPHPGVNMFTADLYQFFANEFGFDQTDTVTIMGAHTIGVLATENSGIDGPNGWVLKNKVFDNGYYAELIGGQDPNTDTTDTMVNNAPPWVRLFQSSAGNGFPDERYWRGTPSHVNIVMLNTDMALVRELDSSNMDASRGEVSCTFTRATSSPPELQVCPFVSGAILTGAGFKANNEKWLSSFQDVLKRMLMRGYALPSSCQEPVCKLQHS